MSWFKRDTKPEYSFEVETWENITRVFMHTADKFTVLTAAGELKTLSASGWDSDKWPEPFVGTAAKFLFDAEENNFSIEILKCHHQFGSSIQALRFHLHSPLDLSGAPHTNQSYCGGGDGLL